MASFNGRRDIDSSRGNEQPASYMVCSSVTVRADAYVRTSSDGNTAGRMYSPFDFGPVPRICLKRRHDEQCSAGPSTSAAIQEEEEEGKYDYY